MRCRWEKPSASPACWLLAGCAEGLRAVSASQRGSHGWQQEAAGAEGWAEGAVSCSVRCPHCLLGAAMGIAPVQ